MSKISHVRLTCIHFRLIGNTTTGVHGLGQCDSAWAGFGLLPFGLCVVPGPNFLARLLNGLAWAYISLQAWPDLTFYTRGVVLLQIRLDPEERNNLKGLVRYRPGKAVIAHAGHCAARSCLLWARLAHIIRLPWPQKNRDYSTGCDIFLVIRETKVKPLIWNGLG